MRRQLGDAAGALQALGHFLALGQTSPLLTSGMFPKLTPELAARASANAGSVADGSQTGMTIGAGLPVEDIAHDPASGRFLVSTVLGAGIVAIDPATQAVTPFAAAPDHWPMLALAMDTKRRRLWATEVGLAGFASVPKAEQGRSTLLEYDLDRRTLLARYPGPPGSDLGDMALDDAGAPIVSDGDGGGVYRLQGGALRRIDHGDFVSPQTVAVCDDGHVFVPDYVRGIATLDLRTGTVRWLSGREHALAGIDGLYCQDHTLVATQNGTAPERGGPLPARPGVYRRGRRTGHRARGRRRLHSWRAGRHGVLLPCRGRLERDRRAWGAHRHPCRRPGHHRGVPVRWLLISGAFRKLDGAAIKRLG